MHGLSRPRYQDDAGIDNVLDVDDPAGSGAPAGTEVMAIRGCGRAVIPDRCHRVCGGR